MCVRPHMYYVHFKHTKPVHETFCESPPSVASMPIATPTVLLCSSVGARRDGFVQLQGGRAELQAAVAAFADAAGLEQLLARHGDLLVAAAGTEDVTAVPAGDTQSERRHAEDTGRSSSSHFLSDW